MIEHLGNSCLVKDSASLAFSLMCKGNSVNLSRTLPSDMSELIFLMFTNLYKTEWEKETETLRKATKIKEKPFSGWQMYSVAHFFM